jgi:hypothetical protein
VPPLAAISGSEVLIAALVLAIGFLLVRRGGS